MEECLDRAMVNSAWNSLFPNATLSNLIATISDHSPYPVELQRLHCFSHRIENFGLRMLGSSRMGWMIESMKAGMRLVEVI